MQTLIDFFDLKDLMPHGYCLLWDPLLLWLHVASDAIITLSYYSIPLSLAYFTRKRLVPYRWLIDMFALFIVACGTTHLIALITIWLPIYWLEAYVKAFTAIISLVTAVLMLRIIPLVLQLPTTEQLQQEIAEKLTTQTALELANARFIALFNNMRNGVAVYEAVDEGNNFIFRDFNRAGEELDGVKRKDLLGKRLTDVFPSVEQFGLLAVMRRVWHTGQAEHLPISLYADGRLSVYRDNYVYQLPTGEVVAVYEDITERKLAELAQQEIAERLEKITNQLPSVVFQFVMRADGSFCIPYVSQVLQRIYHLTPDDVREDASAIFAVVHPDDLARHLNGIKTSAAQLTPWKDEYRLKFPDGTERWCWGNALPQRQADGSILWHGFVMDITERKQAEALKNMLQQIYGSVSDYESQGKLTIKKQQISFADIPELIVNKWQEITNLLAATINVSAALIMKTEYERMEVFVASQSTNNPYYVGDSEHWNGLYCETVIKTQDKLLVPNAIIDEHWANNPDIKLGMMAYLGYPINFPDNHPFGTLCVLDNKENHFTVQHERMLLQFKNMIEIDLAFLNQQSSLVSLNEALQDSEGKLRAIFELANIGIAIVDTQGHFIMFNQWWLDKLGYDAEEVKKLTNFDVTYAEDREPSRVRFAELLAGKIDKYQLEKRFVRKDQTIFWSDLSVSAIRDKNNEITAVVGVITDTTERKRMESALLESEIRLKFLLSNSPVTLYTCAPTPPFAVTYISPNVLSILGYEAEQFLESSHFWVDHIHPDDIERVLTELPDLFVHHSHAHEYRFRLPDGNYCWMYDEIRLILNAAGEATEIIGFWADITERKRMEEALVESEFRWKFAIEGSGDGVWDWNIQSNEALYSKRWLEMLGYTEQDLMPSFIEWASRIHSDDQARVTEVLQTYLAGNSEVYQVEFRLCCKDNSYKWILARGIVVSRDADGLPLRMIGTHTDISERKHIEQALKASEQRLNEIINLMPIALFIKDVNSRVLIMNKACELQWGVSFAQLHNKTGSDVFPPEQMAIFLAADKKLFAEGGVFKAEELIWNTELQSNRLVQVFKKPVFNAAGQPDYLIGLCVDITEQKQQEQALKASEARFRTIIDISPVPMALNDEHGVITFLNTAFVQTFGYNTTDIPTLTDWWPQAYPDVNYRQWVADIWQATLATAEHEHQPFVPQELTIQCKNGAQKTVLGSAAAISETFNKLHLVVLYDITERKQIEAELQRSNAELEQFAYAVSHDMRQPLRMISSYLSLLEQAFKNQLDEDTQQFMNFALDGAKRMDEMILSLLEYSRVGRKTQAMTRISSHAALDEALAFLNPELQASGGTVTVSGDWLDLYASRDELTRLLQNLIGNALKYHEKDSLPRVEVHAQAMAKVLRVTVRDFGIGIAPNQTERLFKVFSRLQARSRFEGTGVGLALCKKIIEHHGGNIGVESAGEGQGSVFWFELPLLSVINTEPTL